MDLSDLSKLDLDPNNIGNWPGPLKGVVILLLCAALLFAGYWFDTKDQLLTLEDFKSKAEVASALPNATVASSVAEVAAQSSTVITMVPETSHVEAVYLGGESALLAPR